MTAKPAARYGALVYVALAVAVALADTVFLLRHYARLPLYDHWIWLERFYWYGLPKTLWMQFNEHRLVIPGLWYFLDHRYFGSANTFLQILHVLMLLGCIVLVVIPAWRSAGVPQPVRFVYAASAAIVMLWFIQADDFLFVYQICFACCNLGILAALHSLARFSESPPHAARIAAAIILCALWANYSNAHGILVWPVILVIGLVLRMPTRWLLAGLAVAACSIGLYFIRYQTPSLHASPIESLRHPLQVIHYAVLMTGIPFFGADGQDVSLASHAAAYVCTTGGILLAAYLLLRFARNPQRPSRGQIIYCGMLLVTLGTCGIAALGRSRFPLSQALSGRYAPIAILFWVSLAGAVTCEFSSRETGAAAQAAWCAAMAALSLATLANQIPLARQMIARERAQEAAALSITVGTPDLAQINAELSLRFERLLYVDRQARPFLGHSLFWHPEAALLGASLKEHLTLRPPSDCLGFVDMVNYLPGAQGAHLLGWAWDAANHREVRRIWVVDGLGSIRGLGIAGATRQDVAVVYSKPAMKTAGWIAYSQLPAQKGDALTVYAGLSDDHSVCQIGVPKTPVN